MPSDLPSDGTEFEVYWKARRNAAVIALPHTSERLATRQAWLSWMPWVQEEALRKSEGRLTRTAARKRWT